MVWSCVLALSLCSCASVGVTDASPAPAAPDTSTSIRASKIVLIGDSTVAIQSGWGGAFCAEHVTSFVACVNLARGGRSSGSYLAEGSWAIALNELRTSGYAAKWLLIQFGHNDQPGKPGRSTNLATEFPANLARYVNEARAVGAQPVLVTPLTRRMFKDGVLQDDLRPWAESMAHVATELKVPLVDLNALSHRAVQAMGSTESNTLAQARPAKAVAEAAAQGTTIAAATEVNDEPPSTTALSGMARSKFSFDYTHLGSHGADYFSAMVTDELARQVPELRPLLVP
jgi:lysophospholipase L1-like esterase